jgi:phosphatidylserine decarboxylase
MVKEGYWYGLPLVLISGGLVGLGLYGFGILFLVAAILVLNFFRDPERTIPSDPSLIVSPADGRVVQIVEEQLDGRLVRRVSIFMSPLDVHVNRAPAAGTIESVVYQKGTFRMATHAEASIENEQNVFTIAGEHGPVVVKQIAGLLARRIVFWKRLGDPVRRGERVGLIKFGSRVDVALDPRIELRVAVGDRVTAGSSVLAVAPRGVTADPLAAGNQPESQES